MPSGRMILTVAIIALLVDLGLERYRAHAR